MKRIISVVTAMCLILSMSACTGGTESEAPVKGNESSSFSETVSTAEAITQQPSDTTEAVSTASITSVPEASEAPIDTEETEVTATPDTEVPETSDAEVDTTSSATTEEITQSEVTTSAARTAPAVTTSKATTTVDDKPADMSDTVAEMQRWYDEKKAEREKLYASISKEKTLPVINITTLNGSRIRSKDEYVTSVIDVLNCDKDCVLSAQGGVKVRGNSTAEQGSEKPYRIKFDLKHNMLGLHDGLEYKSWVLLRSYWNLAPDYMAFSLANEIFAGKYYSSDFTYVNLYLNGKYAGMYLLCEQNQAAKDRIDVYEPKSSETQTDIGYLVELDNYASEEHPYFTIDMNGAKLTDINNVTREIVFRNYSVKSDTNTDEQLDFIEKYITGVFRILYEAVCNDKPMMFDENYNVVSADGKYATTEEAVSEVLDLEAAADMLILQELVHNYDVGAGSFYMAIDFTENSIYKKLTFLAPWDFNWAYNDNSSGQYYAGTFQNVMMDYERSNYWLIMLMKADWFQDIVKERWNELSENNALKSVTAQVKKDLELLRNDLGDNAWSVDTAGQIIDFVNGRIKWLNKQWGK